MVSHTFRRSCPTRFFSQSFPMTVHVTVDILRMLLLRACCWTSNNNNQLWRSKLCVFRGPGLGNIIEIPLINLLLFYKAYISNFAMHWRLQMHTALMLMSLWSWLSCVCVQNISLCFHAAHYLPNVMQSTAQKGNIRTIITTIARKRLICCLLQTVLLYNCKQLQAVQPLSLVNHAGKTAKKNI